MTVRKNKNNDSHSYMKYAGMASQLAILILIGIFIGKKLDHLIPLDRPIATILLIVVFFIGFMYKLYLDLMK